MKFCSVPCPTGRVMFGGFLPNCPKPGGDGFRRLKPRSPRPSQTGVSGEVKGARCLRRRAPFLCACPFRKTGAHFSGTCARMRGSELVVQVAAHDPRRNGDVVRIGGGAAGAAGRGAEIDVEIFELRRCCVVGLWINVRRGWNAGRICCRGNGMLRACRSRHSVDELWTARAKQARADGACVRLRTRAKNK
jgi:hypothetical protein